MRATLCGVHVSCVGLFQHAAAVADALQHVKKGRQGAELNQASEIRQQSSKVKPEQGKAAGSLSQSYTDASALLFLPLPAAPAPASTAGPRGVDPTSGDAAPSCPNPAPRGVALRLRPWFPCWGPAGKSWIAALGLSPSAPLPGRGLQEAQPAFDQRHLEQPGRLRSCDHP